jgi:hypothetical protein
MAAERVDYLPHKDADKPHTIWAMYDDGGPPTPTETRSDTRAEAVAYAEEMAAEPPASLLWLKVFRSDNAAYVAFRWDRAEGRRHDAEQHLIAFIERVRNEYDATDLGEIAAATSPPGWPISECCSHDVAPSVIAEAILTGEVNA